MSLRPNCILTKSSWITIKESWLAEESGGKVSDVEFMRQWSAPSWEGPSLAKHTLLVELDRPLELILAEFKKETRYQVRRAYEKDGLVHELIENPAPDQCAEFAAFFDEFAGQKGLAKANRKYLAAAQRAGCLCLTRAVQSGETLVWHSYLLLGSRARLLHSASLFRRECGESGFRSLVGRANRWLHWQDIQAFKKLEATTYDFGGWYAGKSDEDKLRINRFKEEFGGRPVCEYNGQRALTIRGRLYLWIRSLREMSS